MSERELKPAELHTFDTGSEQAYTPPKLEPLGKWETITSQIISFPVDPP